MTNRVFKFATAASVAAAIIVALTFVSTSPNGSGAAWAIEQTIAALERIETACSKGVRYSRVPGHEEEITTFEIWYRADDKDTGIHHHIRMEHTRLDGGFIAGETKRFKGEMIGDPSHAYVAGRVDGVDVMSSERLPLEMFSAWLEPGYFETLKVKSVDWQEEFGQDEATGVPCVFVTVSYAEEDSDELMYCWFQFDLATKLPVRVKQWDSADREGPLLLVMDEIDFNVGLPDNVFPTPEQRLEARKQMIEAAIRNGATVVEDGDVMGGGGTITIANGKQPEEDQ